MADNSVSPYLRIEAYVHAEGFRRRIDQIDRRFGLVTLDLEVALPAVGLPLRDTLTAWDLYEGVELTPQGTNLLPLVSIPGVTDQGFTVTLRGAAIERDEVDPFGSAARALSSAVAGALGGSPTPKVLNELSSEAVALEVHYSRREGTRSERVLRFAGTKYSATDLSLSPRAVFFLPTSRRARGETPEDRLNMLIDEDLTLCAGDPKTLCTRNKRPFEGYAYVILQPRLSYRIPTRSTIWSNLPVGTCELDAHQVEAFAAGIAEDAPRLTASQLSLERELLSTARNYVEVQDAVAHEQFYRLYGLLFREHTGVAPKSPLYRLEDGLGPSYGALQDSLRACILESADSLGRGLYRPYVTLVREEQMANLETEPARRAERKEAVLVLLQGQRTAVDLLDLDSNKVRRVLDAEISRVEAEIDRGRFQDVRQRLRTAPRPVSAENGDLKLLRALELQTSCASCKHRNAEVIEEASLGQIQARPRPGGAASASTVSAPTASAPASAAPPTVAAPPSGPVPANGRGAPPPTRVVFGVGPNPGAGPLVGGTTAPPAVRVSE
jgi:hypothetical protein